MSVKPTNIPKCHLRKSADSAGNISRHCKLGELTENIRTFALPFENQTYTFKMQYKYDSYNRIQEMTYPDGEVVHYDYNRGGMLEQVTGDKGSEHNEYVHRIDYNPFEQKEKVSYGNGTWTTYDYDSLLRLSRLRSECADGTMQDIVYTYDSVSNITGIVNSAAMLPNGLGGAYSSSYEYDNLYRLVNAEGGWQGLHNLNFQTDMGYHANGRVRSKKVTARTLLNGHSDTMNYARDYYYENPVQRNTLTRVVCFGSTGDYDLHYSWTSAGNMDTCDTEGAGSRRLCWDEQNRLQGVKDNKWLSYYQYDANGDRTYKLTGKGDRQNLSGEWHYYYTLDNATLYASPYLVATRRGYTKHYYAESERIASRVGGGGLQEIDMVEEGQSELIVSHQERFEELFNNLAACLDADFHSAEDMLKPLYKWQNVKKVESDCYWYHPDHLGSSSWITDSAGTAVQHLHYLPWGEDFVNQRLNSFDGVRYTFSAKERDSETGLSYFGSRYYSSDLSIWLSVDPMAAKYPSLSPYVYCADNPVKLVDPNGEDWIVCIESNQYEWRDNIKKDSPIPKGYRYVGANDDDILTDLNIVSNNQTKTATRYGIGISGDEKAKTSAPLLGRTEIQGSLEISARVDLDPTKRTANNRMGKTFKGVEFNATVISQVLSSNDDAAMNYNGALCLTVSGNKIYENLSAPIGNYCIGKNQTIKSASIFFSASNINKNTSFQEATISLGAPNQNMISRPVKMNFNLMLHPIFRAL